MADRQAAHKGIEVMLQEIYASRKPVRFEQIDVSETVLRYLPLGTDRAMVYDVFKKSDTTKIIENTPDKLVVRDNKGQAMLDPDARSVVMTFSFAGDEKLSEVKALHLKNQ